MRDALIGWIGGSLVGTVLCLWDPFGFDAPDHVADASKMVQPAPVTRAEFDALRLRVDRIEAESAVAAPTGRVR